MHAGDVRDMSTTQKNSANGSSLDTAGTEQFSRSSSPVFHVLANTFSCNEVCDKYHAESRDTDSSSGNCI